MFEAFYFWSSFWTLGHFEGFGSPKTGEWVEPLKVLYFKPFIYFSQYWHTSCKYCTSGFTSNTVLTSQKDLYFLLSATPGPEQMNLIQFQFNLTKGCNLPV